VQAGRPEISRPQERHVYGPVFTLFCAMEGFKIYTPRR
jgi:hypothetical protein